MGLGISHLADLSKTPRSRGASASSRLIV